MGNDRPITLEYRKDNANFEWDVRNTMKSVHCTEAFYSHLYASY